jgi:1,4-alpha-glucan branching enzyme
LVTDALTDYDVYLWTEGTHYRSYEKLGAHLTEQGGVAGTQFAVWAPDAQYMSVVGDFNRWTPGQHPMHSVRSSGLWTCFIPNIGVGRVYKYHILSRYNTYKVDKADPYAFATELPPSTASRVWDLSGYAWGDEDWMKHRGGVNSLGAPMAIYEVHLGSWRRVANEGNRWLTYLELATQLADYVAEMGYTHVELLPVTEHPFDGSWGYQTVSYFAPTSRFGTPQDFMFLVDTLHRRGIGVILDWVPAHFPRDEHGLGYFDGTHLYEHSDPRLGEHRDWGTFIYNFGRREVSNFLLSSALFWLDKYHIDGLRVDAVASILYLNYSRKEGEWIPNEYGGPENLDAIAFLKRCNETIYREYPDVQVIAEESTTWPMVSRPTYLGGLGFGLKWDMGWMHDALQYMQLAPVFRSQHHNELTFRMLYAFSENFVLPLSHDEVVHGKASLLAKMPGDEWQKFANLRLLFAYMYAQPGKKLLFMGGEFGQWGEWNHDASLEWDLLQYAPHSGLRRWVRDLNTFYRAEPAFHNLDCDPAGFEWIDANDSAQSMLTFLRKGRSPDQVALVVCNFTPVTRYNYRVGVPQGGRWDEVLNSDAPLYGGSGQGNLGGVTAAPLSWHGRPYLLNLTAPPLAVVVFKRAP